MMNENFNHEYELGKSIGDGGIAVVREVYHHISGKKYAFKQLKNRSKDCIKAIKNEYDFLSTHVHPGIVKVYDFVDKPELIGFVMEYLPGPALENSCGKLDQSNLLKTLVEILEVANFISHCGYIYNDYKPQNFMYDQSGSLKLVDFNLISLESDDMFKKSGTPGYIAPEILKGEKPTSLTDLYSIGVTLYELITGKMPFDLSDKDKLIKLVTESIPEKPGSEDQVLDDIIMKLLSNSPTERPACPFEICKRLNLDNRFADSIKAKAMYYLKTGMISIDEPDVNNQSKDVIDILLKKYSLDDNFMAKIDSYSAGEPQIVYLYFSDLIETDILRFDNNGWYAKEKLADHYIPEKVSYIFKEKLSKLSEKSANILYWLSVLREPQRIDDLLKLIGIEISNLKGELEFLEDAGWIKEENEHYFIPGDSRAESVYAGLSAEQQIRYHERAAGYIKSEYPENYEQLAKQYRKAKMFFPSLEYSLKSARKWFDSFNFNKASEFIDIAESSSNMLEGDNRTIQMQIDTYLLSGDIAKALADNPKAEEKYKLASKLALNIKSEKSLADSYKNLGDLYRILQKPDESIKLSKQALSIYQEMNNLSSQAACFNNIGLAYWTSGDYELALGNFSKALKINKELGNLTEQAKLYNNIGIISDITGRQEQALNMFKQALSSSKEVENPQLEAKVFDNIGFFYLNSGSPYKSLEYSSKGYEITEKFGFTDQQLNIISNIAAAYHKIGDFIKSAEANQKALELATKLKHDMFMAQAKYLLAKDCMAMGNFKLTKQLLEESGQTSAVLSNNELIVDILQANIELELSVGDLANARKFIDQIAEKENMTNLQKCTALILKAELALLEQDECAGELFKALETETANSGLSELTGRAIIGWSRFIINSGKAEKVTEALKRYDSLKIENVLINCEYNLMRTTRYMSFQKYNEALELVKDVRETANKSGCLFVLLKAAILEAFIYSQCGKDALLAKSLRQAKKLYESLLDNLPSDKNHELLSNQTIIKLYKVMLNGLNKPLGVMS